MRRLLALLIALAPLAAAQPNATYPPGAEVPDTEESVEGAPGWSYGSFLLLGVLVFAGALAWASWRQTRRPPSPP